MLVEVCSGMAGEGGGSVRQCDACMYITGGRQACVRAHGKCVAGCDWVVPRLAQTPLNQPTKSIHAMD